MPQQRDPFLWEVRDVVRDGHDLVLITEPWTGRDQVLFADAVSVCNRGHGDGLVEVGLLQGGHFYALETVLVWVDGGWIPLRPGFTFLSKWQVYARFFYHCEGQEEYCCEGDLCELHVAGYVLEPYSSP